MAEALRLLGAFEHLYVVLISKQGLKSFLNVRLNKETSLSYNNISFSLQVECRYLARRAASVDCSD